MAVKKIGVLGTGTTGTGVVQICVEAGYKVVMVDFEDTIVNRSFKKVNSMWKRAIAKGQRTDEEVDRYNTMIITSTHPEDLSDCDAVFECVPEHLEIKQQVFKQLGEICKSDAIMISTTSALSITKIAAESSCAERIIGMHIFQPAYAMKLVEISPGAMTTPATVQAAQDLALSLGKDPVLVNETPGFIVNRLIVPFVNDACKLLEEGVAPIDQIDKAVQLGLNMPMGPFHLADLLGIDVLVCVLDHLYHELDDPRYRPSETLKNMVAEGKLGRKSEKGFYEYLNYWKD